MTAVEWPECDPATVAPLIKGRPHMYAHMPTRFVQYDEAVARGWKYYYDGRVCKRGHIAPFFVSNKSLCVDCDRIRGGQQPIGRKGVTPEHVPVRSPKKNADGTHSTRAPEPTARQKQFLTAYAELKDFDAAAKKVSTSAAVIESELAYSVVFRDAYDNLEERIGVYHMGAYDLDYEWDESKESMFIRTYVNSGLVGTARDAIRVTNYEYEKHLKESPTFAAAVKEAEPLANKLMIDEIRRSVLAGNPQTINKISGHLDLTEPEDPAAGMTDEQLDDEIVRTLGLAKRESNASASADARPAAEVRAGADDPEDVSASEPESFEDLL